MVCVSHVVEANPDNKTMLGFGYRNCLSTWSESIREVQNSMHNGDVRLDPIAISTLNDICTYALRQILDRATEIATKTTLDVTRFCTHSFKFKAGPLTGGRPDASESVTMFGNSARGASRLAEAVASLTKHEIVEAYSSFAEGGLVVEGLKAGRKAIGNLNRDPDQWTESLAKGSGLKFVPGT